MLLLLGMVPIRVPARGVVDSTTRQPHLDPVLLAAIGGATVGGFVYGHVVANDLWWKGERVPFHVNVDQDWRYALGADKLGHMVFPATATRTYATLLRTAGLDSMPAVLVSAGVALTYQTYIEIRDGFSARYGFSPADMVANVMGASFPVLQQAVPALRPFTLQISYDPSQAYRAGGYGSIIDDYTSTTHWVAVEVGALLPRSWSTWYPSWLGIAVGHSVEGLDGNGGGQHVLYLALDWMPERIAGLPPWLREVLTVLHAYHLPAPAVRLTPSVAWFGLKF